MNYPILKTKYLTEGCKSCSTIGCDVCGFTGKIQQIRVGIYYVCEECDGMGEYEVDDGPLDCHTECCPECLGTGDISADLVS